MKKDLSRAIKLIKKKLSDSLNYQERDELRTFFEEQNIEKLYQQLSDDDFIQDKFNEYDKFNYKSAFSELKTYSKKTNRRKIILWSSSIASALLIFFFSYDKLLKLNSSKDRDIKHVEGIFIPGSQPAIFKMADGKIINVTEDSVIINQHNIDSLSYSHNAMFFSKQNKQESSFNELEIPTGGECFMRLEDGTEIWLNSESSLIFPETFSSDKRYVELKGEAYFKVKKDTIPFVVNTIKGDILVLGTSFGITSYNNEDFTATLVSGKIQFQSNANECIDLNPGEQVILSKQGDLLKRTVNIEEYISWKDGLFVFNKKSLFDIMNVLKRWYGVDIIFSDESIKYTEFTGNLERYSTIESFLELLEKLKEIKFEFNDGKIILYKQ